MEREVLDILERQLRDTRRAYVQGIMTYDDMAAAARRLLVMRGAYERASGRRVRSAPTKAQVVALLRSI